MRGESWPCLGRDAEIEQVRRALAGSRTVALLGAAGVGKSHLARTVLDELGRRRVLTHRVIGTSSSSRIPLAALASLVGEAEGTAAAERVAEALGTGLRGSRAPVLLVDDAHHLDEASAGVLLHLAGDDRLRLVLTVRSGERQPDALTSLWTEPRVERIELAPLDAEAIAAVAEHLLGGPVEGRTLHQLVDLSGGNPLLLREVLEGSARAGALVGGSGLWRLTTDIGSTPLLEELLLARLEPLDPGDRELLELVAVAGALDLPLLEEVADLVAAERLERSGLLHVDDGVPDAAAQTAVELAHPLYADLLLARLPVLARRRICRQLADAADRVEERGRPAPVAELRSTVWRFEGGGVIEPDRALDAARRFLAAGDTATAGRLAAAAFEHGGGTEAALLASWCLAECGDHPGAELVLSRASAVAAEPADQALVTLRRAEERFWGARRADEARRLLDEGAAALPVGPLRDILDAQHAVFSMLEGDVLGALERAEQHLGSDDPSVRAIAAIAAESALAAVGRGEDAIELADRTFAEASESPALFGDPGIHVMGRMAGLVSSGRLREGSELMSFVYDLTVGRPDRQARAWITMFWGQCDVLRGQLEDAVRHALESELLWIDGGMTGPARWSAAAATLGQVQLGLLDTAAESLDRLDAYPAEPFTFGDPIAHRARAWVRASAGDRGEAHDGLAAAVEACVATGRYDMAGQVAHEVARLGAADRAVALFTTIPPLGPLTTAHREQAGALAASNADALERLGETYASLGASLDAAESFAAASRAHSARPAVERCLRRCDAEIAACGCTPVTPLLNRAATGSGLSAREADIAALAAAGRTNRQIADELVISERTVENHLYRVFRKLHIGSRAELADVFGDVFGDGRTT